MNPFSRLMTALDAELDALRMVRYRQQVCAVLLSAGDLRYLAVAADELLEAENALAERDLGRAFAADELAEFWDLRVDHPTLAQLSERADPAEKAMLDQRRAAIREAVGEVENLRRLTHELTDASLAQDHRGPRESGNRGAGDAL